MAEAALAHRGRSCACWEGRELLCVCRPGRRRRSPRAIDLRHKTSRRPQEEHMRALC